MKLNRVVPIAVLLGVLALGYWVVSHTRWDTVRVPAALKGEAAKDPHYAARRFARLLGAEVQVLSAVDSLPPRDATLLITAPWWETFHGQEARIRRWVEAGGHLVIDVGVIREDAWAWVGATVRSIESDAEEGSGEGAQGEEGGQSGHHDGMDDDPQSAPARAATRRGAPAQERFPDSARCAPSWEFDPVTGAAGRRFGDCWPEFVYLTPARATVWELHRDLGPSALRLQQGAGRVTAFLGRPFTEDALLREDLATFFALVTDLRPGVGLWFYPATAGAPLPKLVWAQAGTVVTLLALAVALALWRGMPRFGPLAAAPFTTRRALSEQIIGSGEFVHRAGRGEALLGAQRGALEQAARRRLRGYEAMTAEERVRALALACDMEPESLRRALLGPTPGGAADETPLHLLETARRRLRGRTGPLSTTPETPT